MYDFFYSGETMPDSLEIDVIPPVAIDYFEILVKVYFFTSIKKILLKI